MSRFTRVAKIDPATHPLFDRIRNEMGFLDLDEDGIDDFLEIPGLKFVIFADDPNVQKETLDIVVIGPEIRKCFASALAGAWLVDVMKGRALAARWGVRKLPARALFRDENFLGAAEGLDTWEGYLTKLAAIARRAEPPRRTISILSPRTEEA